MVFFEKFGAEGAGASVFEVGEEGFTGISEVQVPENGRFILIYRKDGKKRTKNREITGFFEKETGWSEESRNTAANMTESLELKKHGGIFI